MYIQSHLVTLHLTNIIRLSYTIRVYGFASIDGSFHSVPTFRLFPIIIAKLPSINHVLGFLCLINSTESFQKVNSTK